MDENLNRQDLRHYFYCNSSFSHAQFFAGTVHRSQKQAGLAAAARCPIPFLCVVPVSATDDTTWRSDDQTTYRTDEPAVRTHLHPQPPSTSGNLDLDMAQLLVGIVACVEPLGGGEA